MSKTYKRDCGKQIDIKGVSPFLSLNLAHSFDRIEDSMIDNHTVDSVPLGCREVNGFLAQREVGQITCDEIYLPRISFAKLLKSSLAASHGNEFAFLIE